LIGYNYLFKLWKVSSEYSGISSNAFLRSSGIGSSEYSSGVYSNGSFSTDDGLFFFSQKGPP
jgi:hypothetical protein